MMERISRELKLDAILLAILTLSCASTPADTFKCKAPDGRVAYQEFPCNKGENAQTLNLGDKTITANVVSSDVPSSISQSLRGLAANYKVLSDRIPETIAGPPSGLNMMTGQPFTGWYRMKLKVNVLGVDSKRTKSADEPYAGTITWNYTIYGRTGPDEGAARYGADNFNRIAGACKTEYIFRKFKWQWSSNACEYTGRPMAIDMARDVQMTGLFDNLAWQQTHGTHGN